MTPNSERDELRAIFFEAWRKHREKLPVEPLENQIIEIILAHPEYHELLQNPDSLLQDFGEENPFLHLSLHMAVREQVATNRPAGIQKVYQHLLTRFGDQHLTEHKMLDCLASILWEAQGKGTMPDEENYLRKLQDLK